MTWIVVYVEKVDGHRRVNGEPVEGDGAETVEANARRSAEDWETADPVNRRAFVHEVP